MSVFTQIQDRLKELHPDRLKLKSIPKEDIKLLCQENINSHKDFVLSLSALDKAARNRIKTEKLDMVNVNTFPPIKVISGFYSGLKGTAKSAEDSGFMNSLLTANKDMIKIMDDLVKNIDSIISEDEIVIHNTRVSTLSVLGLMRDSFILSTWSSFFLNLVTKAATGSYDVPGYRTKFLFEHLDNVCSIVNKVVNKNFSYDILKETTDIRKKNADYVLFANGVGFATFANVSSFSSGFTDTLLSFLSIINIFKLIGNKWDDLKHARYMKRKQNKQWLENHVALLKMELLNMSPDDPKRRNCEKIIASYDDIINDLDRKINEYLNED